MKRKTIALLLIVLTVFPLFADERKDKFDFDPPLVPENPLVRSIPSELKPQTGLAISLTGVASGTALSLYFLQSTVKRGLNQETGADLHRDILLTGTCMIGTTVFAIFTDYFIKEIQKKKKITSKE